MASSILRVGSGVPRRLVDTIPSPLASAALSLLSAMLASAFQRLELPLWVGICRSGVAEPAMRCEFLF